VADDGEVRLVSSEIDRRAPEVEQVDQGDETEDENVD
jgi:hypothetical protein